MSRRVLDPRAPTTLLAMCARSPTAGSRSGSPSPRRRSRARARRPARLVKLSGLMATLRLRLEHTHQGLQRDRAAPTRPRDACRARFEDHGATAGGRDLPEPLEQVTRPRAACSPGRPTTTRVEELPGFASGSRVAASPRCAPPTSGADRRAMRQRIGAALARLDVLQRILDVDASVRRDDHRTNGGRAPAPPAVDVGAVATSGPTLTRGRPCEHIRGKAAVVGQAQPGLRDPRPRLLDGRALAPSEYRRLRRG